MPGPGAGAGLGFGLQQAGMGVGRALMQASGNIQNRQIMRREEEILRGREARADERLDLTRQEIEQNRIYEEKRLAEQRRQAQRANARYVADRIRQESRYADSLRMQGVEADVVPGITSMPEPQFQGGVGSALMDVTRRHDVPEGSGQRVPFTRADPESAMAYADQRNRPAPAQPRLIETDEGWAWATPGRSGVTPLEGARPPVEEPVIRLQGRTFPDTPQGQAEAAAWSRTISGSRRGPEDPTDALMRQILGDETGDPGGAPEGSPFRLTPEVPGGRPEARAAEPGEGGETLAQQRASWDEAAAYIRANPEDYDDQSPEEVLGPRP